VSDAVIIDVVLFMWFWHIYTLLDAECDAALQTNITAVLPLSPDTQL